MSENPNVVSRGWDAACNRVCTSALFKDVKTKRLFWVFNVHLDHVGNEARIKGVQLLLDYIFISKNSRLKVQKHAVLSDSKDLKYPSDHLPVYIEIN